MLEGLAKARHPAPMLEGLAKARHPAPAKQGASAQALRASLLPLKEGEAHLVKKARQCWYL